MSVLTQDIICRKLKPFPLKFVFTDLFHLRLDELIREINAIFRDHMGLKERCTTIQETREVEVSIARRRQESIVKEFDFGLFCYYYFEQDIFAIMDHQMFGIQSPAVS